MLYDINKVNVGKNYYNTYVYLKEGEEKMLLSYQECLEKYGTDYKIKKSVQEGELYVKEKGIYSDKRYVPDFYYVAIPKNTRKISDERVKQFYENSEAFDMGKTKMNYDGADIVIYDKERLLVELIRNKRKFSFDFYKEIIASYRRIVHELDMTLVAEYAYELPKSNTVMETLRLEVL